MSGQGLPAKLRAALEELQLDRRAVLDLACGAGAHLAHFGPGSVGLDRDEAALDAARRSGLDVRRADLQQPGWSAALAWPGSEPPAEPPNAAAREPEEASPRGSSNASPASAAATHGRRFEAAWLCDCLVHLHQPRTCLEELAGSLAPGSPVVVVEWCLPEGRLAAAMAGRFPGAASHFAHPEHLHRFTEPALVELLEACGLRYERTLVHGLPGPLRRALGPLLRLIPPRTLIARVP